MMRISFVLFFVFSTIASAQFQNPKTKLFPPDAKLLAEIQAKTAELESLQIKLRWNASQRSIQEPILQIYLKAAKYIVTFQEWFDAKSAQHTVEILNEGLRKTKEVQAKQQFQWSLKAGPMALAYPSDLDESIQPYALVFPDNFQTNGNAKYHLEVILHGRDAKLNEVSFLKRFSNPKLRPENKDAIEIHVYGRGNNAYRWAGEVDVFEALAATIQLFQHMGVRTVQYQAPVLRGFSMGGAGAWHIGLRYPAFWSSISPGAGFNTTRGYLKGLPDQLPDYIEKCLHIYDAIDYVENAQIVPLIAYGGELDPQLQSSKNAKEKLSPLKIPAKFLVGPKTEHKYHPDSLKEILQFQYEQYSKYQPNPDQFQLVTYTPKMAPVFWVQVQAQLKTYDRSVVNVKRQMDRYEIKTENVRLLKLQLNDPKTTANIQIEGQTLFTKNKNLQLAREEGIWSSVPANSVRPRIKSDRFMGPIDDAFRDAFILVEGTGKPWNAAVHQFAMQEMQQFQTEWKKYFRGDLKVVADTAVTEELRQSSKALIAFGDPGSNQLIREALAITNPQKSLPCTWTENTFTLRGKRYSAKDHLPKLIYPSPVSAGYLVINSGHTFHAKDFEGTNALLYPRLGDFAVLKLKEQAGAELIDAGLFDDNWK